MPEAKKNNKLAITVKTVLSSCKGMLLWLLILKKHKIVENLFKSLSSFSLAD